MWCHLAGLEQTGLCHSPTCYRAPQLLPKRHSTAEEGLERGLLALTDAEGVEVGQPGHGLAQHRHRVQPTAVKAGALHILQPHRGRGAKPHLPGKGKLAGKTPAYGGCWRTAPTEAVCAQGLCSWGRGLTSCSVAEHSSMAM